MLMLLHLLMSGALVAAAPTPWFNVTLDLTQAGRLLNADLVRGSIGSSHASTTLRADWQAQLKYARDRIGIRRVRFHGIFDDDMSVVLDDGSFSFSNVWKTFDNLVATGVAPLVELSFMPALFASSNQTIFHYKGNVSPPLITKQWTTLVETFAAALIQRYSATVVSTWLFEVFNEPNCGFWAGTQQQYFDFYADTARALKRVSSQLLVGGPVTCQLAWLDTFCNWCRKNNVPLDVVTSHLYPSDPNLPPGKLSFAAAVNNATAVAAKYGLPFFLSEYNAGLDFTAQNEILDTSYAAAFVGTQLGHLDGHQAGISYWCLSDIFEEAGQYPGEFGTSNPTPFGILTQSGVPKPVFRAFELLNAAIGQRKQQIWNARVGTPAGLVDSVDAWATRLANGTLTVFLMNYWPLALRSNATIAPSNVHISIAVPQAPLSTTARLWRVDDNNANPRAAWVAQGSPVYPTPAQHAVIDAASALVPTSVKAAFDASAQTVTIDIAAVLLDSFLAIQVDF